MWGPRLSHHLGRSSRCYCTSCRSFTRVGRLHRGIASRGGADKQGLRPVRTPTHTFPPVAMERWSPPDQDSWVYRVRRTPRTARDLIGLVYCIRPKNFPFPVFYSRNRFPCMPDSVISTPVPSATGFDLPSGACLIPESYRPLRFWRSRLMDRPTDG